MPLSMVQEGAKCFPPPKDSRNVTQRMDRVQGLTVRIRGNIRRNKGILAGVSVGGE